MSKPAYIFVTGGVMSGLGKGIISSSIGKALQWRGLKVSAMKLDGYLNYDAGTLRPTEHGEVWVTNDGGEIDEDLGHYERFLNLNIPKTNNLTSGQLFSQVIKNEREGKYLGKTVQLIPHVTDEIKRRIRLVGSQNCDVLIVEIGGTVGDYENAIFLEAARQMKMDKEAVVFLHLSYVPVPSHLGEPKTKPTQFSVKTLLSMGIQPDILVCRSKDNLDDVRRKKIGLFCNVDEKNVFSDRDMDSIYELPLELENQGLGENICRKLDISGTLSPEKIGEWKNFIEGIKNTQGTVKVGIVGKYFNTGSFELADSYVSVIEALKHAAWNNNMDVKLEWIDASDFEGNDKNMDIIKKLDGIVVPGGYGESGIEGKIRSIEFARKNNVPFLGLCYGMQLAVIEFARNVCGMEGANTAEINKKTKYPVIDLLPSQKEAMKNSNYGATMRLGGHEVSILPNTLAHKLYGEEKVVERFRHRYEVNPEFVPDISEKGMVFSGMNEKDGVMQIAELKDHKFFLSTQFHPEFTSRPLKPNPLFDGFIKACIQ